MTEDERIGWHHWLNGNELQKTPGDGEGQGSLACCSPWGLRVRHDLATEQQRLTSWMFSENEYLHLFQVHQLPQPDQEDPGGQEDHVLHFDH